MSDRAKIPACCFPPPGAESSLPDGTTTTGLRCVRDARVGSKRHPGRRRPGSEFRPPARLSVRGPVLCLPPRSDDKRSSSFPTASLDFRRCPQNASSGLCRSFPKFLMSWRFLSSDGPVDLPNANGGDAWRKNVPDSVRRRFRCPCLSPAPPIRLFCFPRFPIQPAYFFLSSEIVSGPVSVRFSRVGEYAIFVSRTRSADAALPPVAGDIKNRAQRSVRSCARLKISSAPTQNLNPAESVTVFRSCRVSISPDAITKSSARSSK